MGVFEIEFNPVENRFISDHAISGNPLFPAAAYVEMALANYEHQGGVVRLKRVKIIKPMVFMGGQDRVIRTEYNEGKTALTFLVTSRDKSMEWVSHVEGEISTANMERPVPVNLEIFKQNCTNRVDSETFYNLYKETSLEYGGFYRSVTQIGFNEHEVYSRLCVNEVSRPYHEAFFINPALLDGALQSAPIASFYQERERIYLPFYIEELNYFGRLPENCVCVSKQLKSVSENSPVKKYDIYLCSEDGTVMVEIKALTLKSFERGRNSTQTPQKQVGTQEAPREKDIRPLLEEFIVDMLSDALKIDRSEFNNYTSFMDYGMDSIAAGELVTRLGDAFQIQLDPTLFFDYKNVEELAGYLLDNFPNEVAAKFYVDESGEKTAGTEQNKTVEPHETVETVKIIEQAAAYMPGQSEISTPSIMDALSSGKSSSYEGGCKKEDAASSALKEKSNDIAVIGLAGRFPGSGDVDEFFQKLWEGYSGVTEIPKDRWDIDSFYSEDPDEPGKTNCRYGSFLNDIDKFDAGFFGISANKAPLMDPQQRIMLETAWHAVEDAGYGNGRLSKTNTGVYIAICNKEYIHMAERDYTNITPHMASGNAFSVVANRISYILDVNGPSMAVDTACSSFMSALHNACISILAGECSMALVGGVNLTLSPDNHIVFSKTKVLSPDGIVRPFDQMGNGYIRGEGVGAVLLKPLSKALDDRDNIHAVIKGTAVKHAGRTNGLNTPSPTAERDVILEAFGRAGISADTVSYIEAHATGTELGDHSEMRGLSEAFKRYTDKKAFCAVATSKGNIGHLESASGAAALIKVIMMLKHKKIPAVKNFNKLNKKINMNNSPFFIVDTPTEWNTNGSVRRAGINSFGFGGTNAHVILEEAPQLDSMERTADSKGYLLVVSAEDSKTLEKTSISILSCVRDSIKNGLDGAGLADICYTLSGGRNHYNCRLAVEGGTKEELTAKLESILPWTDSGEAMLGDKRKKQGRACFIAECNYSNLSFMPIFYREYDIYRQSMDEFVDVLEQDIKSELHVLLENNTVKIGERASGITALMHEISLYRLLAGMGINSQAVFGIGSGVLPALVITGVLKPQEAVNAWLEKEMDMDLSGRTPKIPLVVSHSDSFTFFEQLIQSEKTLSRLFENTPEQNAHDWLGTKGYTNLIAGSSLTDTGSIRKKVAAAYVNGADIIWDNYYKHGSLRKVSLPGYSFNKKSYWLTSGA